MIVFNKYWDLRYIPPLRCPPSVYGVEVRPPITLGSLCTRCQSDTGMGREMGGTSMLEEWAAGMLQVGGDVVLEECLSAIGVLVPHADIDA